MPVRVGSDSDWTDVTVGDYHICAIRGGQLWCWGDGSAGQLGLGDTAFQSTPMRVGTDVDWDTVRAGASSTCALKSDRSLWCWGAWGGPTGGPTVVTPERVGGEARWASMALGNGRVCGIREDGTMWCAGEAFERVCF